MNEVYTDHERQPQKDDLIDPSYFTPSIEDFRAGYECEVLHKSYKMVNDESIYKEEWLKVTVKGSTAYLYIGELSKQLIRVPYLTKEQIEAEGWVKQDNNFNETQRCAWLPDYELKTEFGSMRLYILSKDNISKEIIIERYDKSDANDAWSMSRKMIVYRGQCKDINTFRYICKLLNIKNESSN